MTKEIKEQISAFVDNELSEAEASLLIRRLGADATLREEAAKMIRLSQRVRNETSVADDHFAARIFAAIHDEPTLEEAVAADPAPTVNSLGWLRIAGGGGIVAVVALLALNALPDRVETLPPSAVAGEAGNRGAAEALAAEDFEYVTPAVLNDSGLVSANPELAAYFLSHSSNGSSLAPGSGRARMLGGDAIAEDDNDKEAQE